MTAEEEFRLLSRFSTWLLENKILYPLSDDIYRFLGEQR